MRRIGALACALVGLWGCTRKNPAYEDGSSGDASDDSAPLGSSSTRDAAEGDPDVGTSQGSGLGTTTDASSETAEAGGTDTTTGETDETGDPPDPPEPPQVGPFGVPVRLDISSPAADDDPTLPSDMLELYFASFRGGGQGQDDIWVSQRATVTDPWGLPVPVVELSTASSDNTPEISPDGLAMLLSSDRENGQYDVYGSTRRTRGSAWSIPVRIEMLSTGMRDVCPFPTADGAHVYTCVGAATAQDLLRFDRDGREWLPPVPVVELNTRSVECGAWLDASNRLILFVTDRPGGPGSVDLWIATRPSADAAFDEPMALEGVNSPAFDDDPWLSPDGGTLFFASNREPTGVNDLYVAQRPR